MQLEAPPLPAESDYPPEREQHSAPEYDEQPPPDYGTEHAPDGDPQSSENGPRQRAALRADSPGYANVAQTAIALLLTSSANPAANVNASLCILFVSRNC